MFGGGTVGYNMQRGALVFGIEADFGAMDLNGSTRLNGAPLYNTAGTIDTLPVHRNGKSSRFHQAFMAT